MNRMIEMWPGLTHVSAFFWGVIAGLILASYRDK